MVTSQPYLGIALIGWGWSTRINWRELSSMRIQWTVRFAAASVWVCLIGAGQAVAASAVVLVPHRAVYDMNLGEARAGSNVTSLEGRLVYELTGSECAGYTQTMRFVTRLSTQQGEPTINDLRSKTFENAEGTRFSFDSTTLRDQCPSEASVGVATRDGSSGPAIVELTRPPGKPFTTTVPVLFPVQHSLQLIEAARAGNVRLQAHIYDGSEAGEKIYDTIATIGRRMSAEDLGRLDTLPAARSLDALAAWPVTITYFELGAERTDAVPVYELSFLYFENGVSRRLKIDYGDFAIEGDLTDITFLPETPCAGRKAR